MRTGVFPIDRKMPEQRYKYFDKHGVEIQNGDFISDGKVIRRVMLSESGQLCIDATNPSWIKNGRAGEGEFGLYPLNNADMEENEKVFAPDNYPGYPLPVEEATFSTQSVK